MHPKRTNRKHQLKSSQCAVYLFQRWPLGGFVVVVAVVVVALDDLVFVCVCVYRMCMCRSFVACARSLYLSRVCLNTEPPPSVRAVFLCTIRYGGCGCVLR